MSAKILAVDTAAENCSVALVMGDQVFARSEGSSRPYRKILPMVDEVLKEANIALTDIDAIAFGKARAASQEYALVLVLLKAWLLVLIYR